MISDRYSDYNTICKLFNFSKENSADINKKLLLEMAKNGENKPLKNYKSEYKKSLQTKLGRALSAYTIKSSGSYDPIFTKQIKKLRPDWFVSQSEKANEKKKLLLKMAENGEKKPNQKTKLGKALSNYTLHGSRAFDSVFTKQIRKLRPDWFVTKSEIVNQNKKILLEMAENGEDKPHRKTKLGRALSNYTYKGDSYDPIFTKQIRKLRPDWFIK